MTARWLARNASRSTMVRRTGAAGLLLTGLALGACTPPPVGGDGGPAGNQQLLWTGYAIDTPAIGANWYAYDTVTHYLTAEPRVYVLRDTAGDAPRYAALRVETYYDPDTAESGTFTLDLSTWQDGAWSAAERLRTPNVKNETTCLDVFTRATTACSGSDWQVRMGNFKSLKVIKTQAFIITDAGINVRARASVVETGEVHVARLDDRDSLDGLPDPQTIDDVDQTEVAPLGWDRSTGGHGRLWQHGAYAPNWSTPGLTIGTQLAGDAPLADHVLFGYAGRDVLFRFTLSPTDGGIALEGAASAVEGNNAAKLAYGETFTATLTPGMDQPAFYKLTADGVQALAASDTADATWLDVPDVDTWSFAVDTTSSGAVRVFTSQALGLFDATAAGGPDAAGIAEATPPTTSNPQGTDVAP